MKTSPKEEVCLNLESVTRGHNPSIWYLPGRSYRAPASRTYEESRMILGNMTQLAQSALMTSEIALLADMNILISLGPVELHRSSMLLFWNLRTQYPFQHASLCVNLET